MIVRFLRRPNGWIVLGAVIGALLVVAAFVIIDPSGPNQDVIGSAIGGFGMLSGLAIGGLIANWYAWRRP